MKYRFGDIFKQNKQKTQSFSLALLKLAKKTKTLTLTTAELFVYHNKKEKNIMTSTCVSAKYFILQSLTGIKTYVKFKFLLKVVLFLDK